MEFKYAYRVAGFCCVLIASPCSAVNYGITPIAPIGAPSNKPLWSVSTASINQGGQIAGSYLNEQGERYIYLWDKSSGLTDLWQQPGRQDYPTHVAINDNGTVAQGVRIGDQSGFQQLSFTNATHPEIMYIGNDGTLGVRDSSSYSPNSVIRNPVGTEQLLPDITLVTMNRYGDYIGEITIDAPSATCYPASDGLGDDCFDTAVANIGGQQYTIGLFDGNSTGSINDLNDNGQVVWSSYFSWFPNSRFTSGHLFENGVSQDLEGEFASPMALNNFGTIVGYTCVVPSEKAGLRSCNLEAAIWENGNYSVLANLIVNDMTGITLLRAEDINDQGEIVAEGVYNGVPYSFYLAPVPLPPPDCAPEGDSEGADRGGPESHAIERRRCPGWHPGAARESREWRRGRHHTRAGNRNHGKPTRCRSPEFQFFSFPPCHWQIGRATLPRPR